MEDKKEKGIIDKDENQEKKKITEKDKQNFLEQIENLKKTQELLKMGNFNAIKSEYKFWSTQPVPQLNRECKINFGPIIKENIDNIQKEPYNLPEGFEWKEIDLSQNNEVDKLYEFLKSNFIGDESHLFGTEYSKDFLKWFLSPPNMFKEWLISVVKEDKIKNKKKIIGFISAIPSKINIKFFDLMGLKYKWLKLIFYV